MSKITLNSIASLDTINAATTINNNMTTIQTAFDNTLSRDGTSPNTMGASFDMNSNRILNLPAPATGLEPLRVQDLQSYAVTTNNQITTPTSTVIGSIVTWNATNGLTLGTATTTGTGNVVLSTNASLTTPTIASATISGTVSGNAIYNTGQINANTNINVSASFGGNLGFNATNSLSTGNASIFLNNDIGSQVGFFMLGSANSAYAGAGTFNFGSISNTATGIVTNNTLRLFIGASGGLTVGNSINDQGAGNLRVVGYVQLSGAGITVASLPTASPGNKGATAFVTDANSTTFASVVAGGGANGIPVYSDGSNWRIG